MEVEVSEVKSRNQINMPDCHIRGLLYLLRFRFRSLISTTLEFFNSTRKTETRTSRRFKWHDNGVHSELGLRHFFPATGLCLAPLMEIIIIK